MRVMELNKHETRQVKLIEKDKYTEVRFNNEIYSKDLYAQEHGGKNWQATASGNVHYYRSNSGKEIAIEQSNFKLIGLMNKKVSKEERS